MTVLPAQPRIYHITHVDNLRGIVADGGLISDREMLTRGGPVQPIGMSDIKRRRLDELEVHCHPGTRVGDYVPFYFCPRSIMLYVIYRANNRELTYRGGQVPIVHLEADLYETIQWARKTSRVWAFSLSNAGAYHAEFRSRTEELIQLDWKSIAERDFRPSEVREHKQAEFLVYEQFPFTLVKRIGVHSNAIRLRAIQAIGDASHRPVIQVQPDWYF